MPAYEALGAVARQPFLASKLSNFMLLSQSLIQTPLIFGFIVALIIRTKFPFVTTFSQALTLIGSGAAIGLGCIGPAFGGGFFTKTACQSAGVIKPLIQSFLRLPLSVRQLLKHPLFLPRLFLFFLLPSH